MPDTPTRIIIDTDPGIDDVVALALAALSPELDIVAITTTYGNVSLDLATSNARRLLDLTNSSRIPVYPGSDRPMLRDLVTATDTHGQSGIGYASSGPKTEVTPNRTAILNALRNEPKPITLVTLGPLTNLAHALEADPVLVKERITRHIGMFGNLHERGNTNRWADFNAWCDPEATKAVLKAQLPTEMVGLDVTRQMVVSGRETDWLCDCGDRLAAWLGQALRFYVEFHQLQESLDGCVVNDILPVGELLHPGLLGYETHQVDVDLSAGEERGRTRTDKKGFRTQVATSVDINMMRKLLDRVFSSNWRKPLEE